jgi:hypothetical protein
MHVYYVRVQVNNNRPHILAPILAVLYSGGTSSNKCVKERAPHEAEEIKGDFAFLCSIY